MELIVLIGIQASGKSTFCRDRFFNTHIRVNLDMLKTRHRENMLVEACIASKTSFVVDNTNLTKSERAKYIVPAKKAGFAVHGYYFQSIASDSLVRNGERGDSERVPEVAIRGAVKKLEKPSALEGFDRLFFVRLDNNGRFTVDDWKDEI